MSWRASSLSPRSATLVMLSFMIPTVASISCWIAWVLLPLAPVDAAGPGPPPGWFGFEPGMYGSYWSDLQENWYVDRERVSQASAEVCEAARRVRDGGCAWRPEPRVAGSAPGATPLDKAGGHLTIDFGQRMPCLTTTSSSTAPRSFSARRVSEEMRERRAYMSLKSVVDG